MRNANYIGRVGALAVALGIGVGLIATPWVAAAKPADTSSASANQSAPGQNKPADSSSANPSAPGQNKPADTGSSSANPNAPGQNMSISKDGVTIVQRGTAYASTPVDGTHDMAKAKG